MSVWGIKGNKVFHPGIAKQLALSGTCNLVLLV